MGPDASKTGKTDAGQETTQIQIGKFRHPDTRAQSGWFILRKGLLIPFCASNLFLTRRGSRGVVAGAGWGMCGKHVRVEGKTCMHMR
jgi:hypothetical protein